MSEEESQTEFIKQFSGSAAVTGLILLVMFGLRKLCTRKSKCKTKLHTCCLDVDIRDDTIRNGSSKSTLVGEAQV